MAQPVNELLSLARRIRKFVRYLLSSNIGETIAILLTIVMRGPLILLPVQILWINVVTDAVTAIALGLEPAEADLMRRPPRGPQEPILDRAGVLRPSRLRRKPKASRDDRSKVAAGDAKPEAAPEGGAAPRPAR